MNDERMDEAENIVADPRSLVHASRQIVGTYSQRHPGKQHSGSMRRQVSAKRNRKPDRSVKVDRRRFDDDACRPHSQGDDARFDEVDILDPPLRLFQDRSFLQGNK